MTTRPDREDDDGATPDSGERQDLRQDDAGSRPVGARISSDREEDHRGHAREAQPYEDAPAEGHLSPEAE